MLTWKSAQNLVEVIRFHFHRRRGRQSFVRARALPAAALNSPHLQTNWARQTQLADGKIAMISHLQDPLAENEGERTALAQRLNCQADV